MDVVATPPATASLDRRAALEKTAREFEAAFLSEMLQHSGMGRARAAMGGGAGEDAFASLLAREQAKAFADAGGIGLARHIFDSLWEGTDA
ncbi:rod-binding protein [Pontivivens ytuae]|uniref:Rod-binding protein n=1 Tax=Pontivivens ytuae TaxID=2789856 RepID=A0A7S9QC69_9RHOB|nr:rod-binding protein [Pontivivens ytuae]QPH53077.1 rod-binding protein [Pontivivens ytuae]